MREPWEIYEATLAMEVRRHIEAATARQRRPLFPPLLREAIAAVAFQLFLRTASARLFNMVMEELRSPKRMLQRKR
jgi:hypothetical protein